MLGRFDEARAILEETRTALAERGATQRLGVITGIESAAVEITAGNLDRAAELGAEGCRILEELWSRAFLSYATARLANTLVGLAGSTRPANWHGARPRWERATTPSTR